MFLMTKEAREIIDRKGKAIRIVSKVLSDNDCDKNTVIESLKDIDDLLKRLDWKEDIISKHQHEELCGIDYDYGEGGE